MRHRNKGSKLGKNHDQRKQLIRSLVRDFIRHGHITTTVPRGKELTRRIEHLVTLAKRQSNAGMRKIMQTIDNGQLVKQFLSQTSPFLAKRTSGFTRRVLLPHRFSDATIMVKVTWVDSNESKKTSSVVKVTDSKQTKMLPKKSSQ